MTVSVQPTGQICTVTGGTGTVGTANVTTVVVSCKTTYTIGGTLSGLKSGASVTLLDNSTNALKLTANGTFTFTTPVASGKSYKVTVSVQPSGEYFTVTGGTGTVGTANVTTVVVSCKTTYTIGGTLSGLNSGASVTPLLDNGSNALTLTANGTFTFTTPVASGKTYNVTVSVQPTGETCTVTEGDRHSWHSQCANHGRCILRAKTFTIGGTLSGLNSGTSVTLLDNGTDSLKVTANGTFTFENRTGQRQGLQRDRQRPADGRDLHGDGRVPAPWVPANVTTVVVTCKAAATFTIGGNVSGLNTGTSVTLLDNGSDSLKVAANGAFTFATPVASGSPYSVTVSVLPTRRNLHGYKRFRHRRAQPT